MFLFSMMAIPSQAQGVASAPTPPNVVVEQGSWFEGAVPPNVDYNKSPIVFIHGLNGSAVGWFTDTLYYGKNDMYDYAYRNGYRTAFVNLRDVSGTAGSVWYNGSMLANMLKEMYEHFGKKLTIIAHSKGGVDAQAALVHYGASSYVNDVVTLGSPHHGTQLADLAYSWWAGWLAKIIGQKNDGAYAMQTGEMQKFRALTDKEESVYNNSYYTASGKGHGPFLSAYWFGGAYLKNPNDGVVREYSTKLPYGYHFLRGGKSVNHDNIRKGSVSFSLIQSVLHANANKMMEPLTHTMPENESAIPEQLLRGGPLEAGITSEVIPIESGNDVVEIQVLTGKRNDILLSSSHGNFLSFHTTTQLEHDDSFFTGAYLQTYTLQRPKAGEYNVEINSEGDDAYFIIVNYKGSNDLNQQFSSMEQLDSQIFSSKNILKIKKYENKENSLQKIVEYNDLFDGFDQQMIEAIQRPTENITYDIVGQNEKGELFYRTVVNSSWD